MIIGEDATAGIVGEDDIGELQGGRGGADGFAALAYEEALGRGDGSFIGIDGPGGVAGEGGSIQGQVRGPAPDADGTIVLEGGIDEIDGRVAGPEDAFGGSGDIVCGEQGVGNSGGHVGDTENDAKGGGGNGIIGEGAAVEVAQLGIAGGIEHGVGQGEVVAVCSKEFGLAL